MTIIKNYEATISSTTITKVDSEDFQKKSLEYYWINDGENQKVKCTVTLKEQEFAGETTFNVKKPASNLTTQGTSVNIHIHTNPETGESMAVMEYAQGYDPGIKFSRTVEYPSGFSGETQYWQRVNSTLHRVQRVDNVWGRRQATNVLDNELPYSSSSETEDSPGLELHPSYKYVSASDSFTMWLMFKPSGSDSIWVPLQSVTWSWKGSASRIEERWKLDDRGSNSGTSSETNEFPEWQGNIRDFDVVEETE